MSHHQKPDCEDIYDKEVSPLVTKLLDICNSTTPTIPIVTCSSYWDESRECEGVCSSAIIKEHASLRMQQVLACARNGGRAPMAINARLMMGGGSEWTREKLDAKWYKETKEHTSAYKKIYALLEDIVELVDHKYHFPTAIVIQNPGRVGGHDAFGKWGSKDRQGIQFMRVIAVHGYSKEAAKLLMGVGLGNPEHDSMFDMISSMQELNEAKKKGGIRGMLKTAREQQIRKNIQESEKAFKRGKAIIPMLRIGEGEEEELDEAREEERKKKADVKIKKEVSEKRKREKAISSVKAASSSGRNKPTRKKSRSSSSTKKKNRGVRLSWSTPSQKKEKELARKDRENLTKSIRKGTSKH